MRVFVTGASGFIGQAVVKELVAAGHAVTGLARSERSAQALAKLGAQAHPGGLQDLESLRAGAAAADGAIHLAFIHAPGDIPLGQRLGIFLGGAPSGIVPRFMAAMAKTDRNAIDALAGALEGSGRPLVTTFGTMGMTPGRLATEDEMPDPTGVGAGRAKTEDLVRRWGERGVRTSIIRLSPSVHGDGDKGFVPRLITVARKKKSAAYVATGENRWPGVHRLDAAVLYRLALEKGQAGAAYHGVGDEAVPFRQIAEVIGRRLNVPTVSVTQKEASRQFGWIGPIVARDNPTSSALTQERLGWRPIQPGLLADIDRPEYF